MSVLLYCVCFSYCSGKVDGVGGGQCLDRLQTLISESGKRIKAELL